MHHTIVAHPSGHYTHHTISAPPSSHYTHHTIVAAPSSHYMHHTIAAPPSGHYTHHTIAAPVEVTIRTTLFRLPLAVTIHTTLLRLPYRSLYAPHNCGPPSGHYTHTIVAPPTGHYMHHTIVSSFWCSEASQCLPSFSLSSSPRQMFDPDKGALQQRHGRTTTLTLNAMRRSILIKCLL